MKIDLTREEILELYDLFDTSDFEGNLNLFEDEDTPLQILPYGAEVAKRHNSIFGEGGL